MKKEKNPLARKTNKILAGAWLIVLVLTLPGFFQEKLSSPDLSQLKYLEVIENNQRKVLELSKSLKAKEINPKCPDKSLENLDLVVVNHTCQIIPEGASNWTRLFCGKKMLLNQATSLELQLLRGIGEKQAEKILQLKKDLKGFSSFEQLESLGKISPQKMQEFKRYFMIKENE